MDGLDFNNILDDAQAQDLFGGIVASEENIKTPDTKEEDKTDDEPNDTDENNNHTEVEEEELFTPKTPESVGNDDDSQEEEDTQKSVKAGTSPEQFFSSIAEAIAEEGIFPDLDKDTISNIKTAKDLREAIEEQINAGLEEKQRRVLNALDSGIDAPQIAQYERVIANLDALDEETLSANDERGEELRRNILFQDYINRGFSEARAKKAVERAFESGTDIEDAQEALESCKQFYADEYNNLLEEADKAKKAAEKEQKKKAEKLQKTILEGDLKFFGDIEIDKKTRKAALDAITKPIYKDDAGNYYTAMQKAQLDGGEEFFAKLGMLYAMTDGFKNLDKLIKTKAKKEVKKGFAALDKKINASNVVSGGTLKFVSGSGDGGSSMYGGQNIGLAF